jgi:uncharacterized metal-binding protein
MSDGQVHLIGNLIFGGALTGATFMLAREYTPYVFVGSVIGTIVTPDMDVDHKTETEQIMNQVPGIGWLFGQAWYGYALIANHRGLSHNLFLGTVGRVVWTLLIALVALIFISGLLQLFGVVFDPLATMRAFTAVMLNPVLLLSWLTMDCMHYLLDSKLLK